MRHLKSLRTKFVRTMLLVTGIIGAATLAIVVAMSAQASSRHLASVEHYIEQGIRSKGKVLTENHALALRSLTLDNAFLDMQRLVERAVQEDPDLLYGLYVNAQGQVLAYARRGAADPALTPPPSDAPDERALRELGLSQAELLVPKPLIDKRSRLGESLLEVAVPVFGEDAELMGTIRYGLSTARMHDALARAQDDARSRLSRSLWWVGSLVGAAVMLGALLSRMQGGRITRPVSDLTVAAQSLASGNRAVRVRIESGDELELLGESFNRMVEELDASYRSLEEMNHTLEEKVEERTVELGRKNRDMRLVLDNVDQGFLTLSPDGTMGLERSKVLDQWFGDCDEPRPFWDYMAAASPIFATAFRLGWEQLMDDILPLEASLAQLPIELKTSSGRGFAIRYLPFHRDARLEGVLVVVADVTERLAKAREEAEQAELMEAFKKLMLDRCGFEVFAREGNQLVADVCGRRLDSQPTLLKRAIHTLKGNTASMGFGVLAELCHRLEEELAERQVTSDATLNALSARWRGLTSHLTDLVGNSTQKTIEIPSAAYQAMVARLSTESVSPDVLEQLNQWQLEPIARPFKRLAEQAESLARRLNKGPLDIVIDGGGLRVDGERFAPFFSDLVHVIRNAVDHGLEEPAERVAKGKPDRGNLVFRAFARDERLTIEIGDDGRGIDWDVICQRAQERGLPHQSQSELTAALCSDGITSRAAATTVSGRGIGMAAVQQRVQSLGGSIDVRSTSAAGTTWIFRFPLSSVNSATTQRKSVRSRALAVVGEGSR